MGYWQYMYNATGFIVWLLFWAIIVLLLLRLIRGGGPLLPRGHIGQNFHNPFAHHSETFTSAPPPPAEKTDTALQILKERYAKSEITKMEFEEKRADILRT